MLHAQPIVDLATGEATQYELLLRMRDADGELIPPAAFLPVAERFGLIGGDRPLGRRARDPHARRRAARRPPPASRGQPLRPLGRRPRAARADRARAARQRGRPEPAHLRDHRDRRGRQHPARAATSPPASPTSAAASRSTTSAPASAPSTTSSTCRSTTSRSTASSCATRAADPTDQLVIQAVVDIARGLGKRTVAEYVGDAETAALLRAWASTTPRASTSASPPRWATGCPRSRSR